MDRYQLGLWLGWVVVGSLGVLGCPSNSGSDGDGDDDGTTEADDDDDDDDDDDGSVSSSDTSTGTSEDSSTGSTLDSSSGTDESSGSSGESDSSGSSGSSSDSTGNEVCMIDLPPPPKCGEAVEPADGFVIDPLAPQGGIQIECDIWAQDCPDGEKCMPWANDGGSSWNATRCSPVDDVPVDIGGACTVEGSGVSGIDNCVLGAMCWDVDADTNMGTCIELCSCNEANPVCNTANTTCSISNDGVLPLCLPVCNPNDPASCPDGELCIPSNDVFVCAPDASGAMGAAGDECQYVNVCDPGLFCANGDAVPGCASVGCCSAFCTGDDASGCEAGQECLPWYEDGQAPDECLGTVGACAAN